MPFKSQAQKGYLYANEPAVAAKFQAETPKGATLPARKGKSKKHHLYAQAILKEMKGQP